MTSIPSAAALRNTKQPIPTERLIRWAEDAGFEAKSSGSGTSHIHFKHKVFSDLTFGMVYGSKKISSQRNLSDALIELQKRQESVRAANAFEIAAPDPKIEIEAKLPAHIEVERDDTTGQLVLRDKQITQLGLTLRPGEEKILENKVRFLESLKREAGILLNRARNIYDIDIGSGKNGVFAGTLSHPIYNMAQKTLPPYKAGNEITFFQAVNDYIAEVADIDAGNKTTLTSALRQSFVKSVFVLYHSRRGERTNVVSLENPDGGTLRFKFETASNRRADSSDLHAGRITEQELRRVETFMTSLAREHTGQKLSTPAAEPIALRA